MIWYVVDFLQNYRFPSKHKFKGTVSPAKRSGDIIRG